MEGLPVITLLVPIPKVRITTALRLLGISSTLQLVEGGDGVMYELIMHRKRIQEVGLSWGCGGFVW